MMRKKISIIFAGIVCVTNAYLAGELYGYERGLDYAASLYGDPVGIGFNYGDTCLAETHLYLALCSIIFLIGLSLVKHAAYRIVCLSSLLLALFIYLRWIGLMILNSEHTFLTNLLQSSSALDWLSFLLLLVLMGEQTLATPNHNFIKNKEL